MSKCPKCGVEVEDGAKFCMECGEPIPQTKECPKCHAQWPLKAKFCAECGYNFNADATGVGSVIGDKNVIAGDVHIDQSSTVTNNTVNNVTNTTTIINQDETKKLVACAVCGKQLVIVDAIACKSCGKFVCASHFHSESEKCSACHTVDIATYKRRITELIAGGVIGVKEDAELATLARAIHLTDEDAANFRSEIERSINNTCEVVLQIKGSYLHVGREPIAKLEKLEAEGVLSIAASAPDKCFESVYALDSVNSNIEVSLDWLEGEIKKHFEQYFGSDENGPRNIQYVEGEESFGVYDDCAATLYVTETTASEDNWNSAHVSFKVSFKAFGDFKPSDICITYGLMSFDDDFKRIISITYKGRLLPVAVEIASEEGDATARDSWIETKNRRYEYNVWAKTECKMLVGTIRSKAIYFAVADFSTLDEAEQAISQCCGDGNKIRELVVGKAIDDEMRSGGTLGTFLDTRGAKFSIRKKYPCRADVNLPVDVCVSPNFSVENRRDVFECEDVLNSDRYVNSNPVCLQKIDGGKARVTYFERRNGRVDFEFFCVGKFNPEKVSFYLQPTGMVDDSGVPQMLIADIGYSVPSYGKRFKYVYPDDEMNEEIECSNKAIQLDDDMVSWYVVEGNGQVKIIQL